MFTAQYVALASRKARLLERIEAERSQLAACGEQLKKPFMVADKIVQAGLYIKQHPWIAGVAAAAVVVLGRRNLLRWAGRTWTVWRVWRSANRWLRQVV